MNVHVCMTPSMSKALTILGLALASLIVLIWIVWGVAAIWSWIGGGL